MSGWNLFLLAQATTKKKCNWPKIDECYHHGTDETFHAGQRWKPTEWQKVFNGFVLADDPKNKTKHSNFSVLQSFMCTYTNLVLDAVNSGIVTAQNCVLNWTDNNAHNCLNHPALIGLTDATLSNWALFTSWILLNMGFIELSGSYHLKISLQTILLPDGTSGNQVHPKKCNKLSSDIS